MRFNSDKPIFIQIANLLSQDVISGKIKPQSRFPSARDLAVSFEVNPNTAARALQSLADAGIAVCERGTGYFISADAMEKVRAERKSRFFAEELPAVMTSMKSLGISLEEIEKAWRLYDAGKEKPV